MRGETIKRLKLCSSETDFEAAKLDLKIKLIKRSYPTSFILEYMEKVSWSHRDRLIAKTLKKLSFEQ